MILETDHGTFEGETEKELLKLSRAAKRATEKQEKIDHHNRNEAQRNAYHSAYRVLDTFTSHDNGPPAYRIYCPSNSRFPKHRRDDVDVHDIYKIETTRGDADLQIYSSCNYRVEVLGVLRDGMDNMLAWWLRDHSSNEVTCYALGVHETVAYMLRLGGLTWSQAMEFFIVSE